jgi:hypothetical protein
VTELSDQQSAILLGTRAADAAGRPLVLWHGTRHAFDRFASTSDLGFHFGSRRQAQRRLQTLNVAEIKAAPGPDRLIPVALKIANPVFLPDDPRAWTGDYLIGALRRFLPAGIQAEIRKLLPREFYERRAILDLFRQGLKETGHDGIVYRNSYESSARSVSWSWLALTPEDIVMLPPCTDAAVVDWPAGVVNGPGFDADAELARVGGIRTQAGKLKLSSDRRAVLEAAADALGKSLPGEVQLIGDKDHAEARFTHAGRLVQIEVMGRIGRLRATVGAYQQAEIAELGLVWGTPSFDEWRRADTFLASLSGAHSDDRVRTDRDHHGIYLSWQPGQPLKDFVREFTELLSVSLAALPPPPAPGHAAPAPTL